MADHILDDERFDQTNVNVDLFISVFEERYGTTQLNKSTLLGIMKSLFDAGVLDVQTTMTNILATCDGFDKLKVKRENEEAEQKEKDVHEDTP